MMDAIVRSNIEPLLIYVIENRSALELMLSVGLPEFIKLWITFRLSSIVVRLKSSIKNV